MSLDVITEIGINSSAEKSKDKGWSKNSSIGSSLYPIYHTEEMLWTNHKLYPRAGIYHVSIGFSIIGNPDQAIIQRTIERMVFRHEIFRTTFYENRGRPLRIIHKSMPLSIENIKVADQSECQAVVLGRCQAPFNLRKGPLWRAAIIDDGVSDPLLLFVFHHIIFDASSIKLFSEDFIRQYNAECNKEPVRDRLKRFLSYILKKLNQLTDETRNRNHDYWVQKISGMERLIELPFYRCPNDERRFCGGCQRTTLGQVVGDKMMDFCMHTGMLRRDVMIAALVALLFRYFGSTDNTVLSLVDDRMETGFDDVIGFAGNVLPIRTVLSGHETFLQLAKKIAALNGKALQHREIPFNDIVQILRGEEGHVTEAPFHVMFEEREPLMKFHTIDGASFIQKPIDNGLAKMPLSLTAAQTQGDFELTWEYNKHIFDEITVAEIAEQYSILLGELCSRSKEELETFDLQIPPRRVKGNPEVYSPFPFKKFPKTQIEQSIINRFGAQVGKFSDKVALCTGRLNITYKALNESSNRLAKRLAIQFGTQSKRYALCFQHDAALIAAVLGVLKAAGTFVPLDLSFPSEHLLYVLTDADVAAIVGNRTTVELCWELCGSASIPFVDMDQVEAADELLVALTTKPQQKDLAYMLYTSGSTGKPKAVYQTHRNLLHHIRMWTNSLRISEHDHHTLFSAFPWDSSVQDIFGTLLNGATLCLLNIRESNLRSLPEWISENNITVMHMTIPLFRRLLKTVPEKEALSTIRVIAAGGDAMHRADLDLFKQFFPDKCNLVNMYGAMESPSALYYVAGRDTLIDGEVVPLGYPSMEDSVVLIRNGVQQRAHSVVGEIAIKGDFVAPGYWNNEDEIYKRYVNGKGNQKKRMYMTGDLGRTLPDGSIEYVARLDHQVKIRGFRVELGEIEAVVAEHPSVKEVIVIADDTLGDEKELIVYYVPHEGREKITAKEIREHLLSNIPDYMVPRYLVNMDSLPLTLRGKIDRKALPKPSFEMRQGEMSSDYKKERTSVEETLIEIWEDVLKVKPIGIRDNFFSLGGHSILGFEMFDRIQEQFSLELAPTTLHRGAATVELLALAIENESSSTKGMEMSR